MESLTDTTVEEATSHEDGKESPKRNPRATKEEMDRRAVATMKLLRRKPMDAYGLADALKLSVPQVSVVLNNLMEAGVVERGGLKGRKALYQVRQEHPRPEMAEPPAPPAPVAPLDLPLQLGEVVQVEAITVTLDGAEVRFKDQKSGERKVLTLAS